MSGGAAASIDVVAIGHRIMALQLVNCRMVHERVRSEQGQLVRLLVEGGEGRLARLPLCSREIRAQRLACGHTTARDRVRRDLRALLAAGALSEPEHRALADELDAIGNDIQGLDHRKGDAEKDYALATEDRSATGALAVEMRDAAVRVLEREHDSHVERLRAWRERLLNAIQR
jgi:hypothetical protein